LASRYPKKMYEELTEVIFSDDTKEIVFYAACLTMYRFTLLVSNSHYPSEPKAVQVAHASIGLGHS
jgi:hypothetical protein